MALNIAATHMASGTEQRKGELTSSTRTAAVIILALGCFTAVLIGGVFVGQTIGDALSTVEMIAPAEIAPLR